MKFLLILILFLFLAAMIAVRYKKQIIRLIQFWKTFTALESEQPRKQVKRENSSGDIRLVTCAKCGSWIAQNQAVKTHGENYYCSAKCFEKVIA